MSESTARVGERTGSGRPSWSRRYARALAVVDTAIIVWAVAGAQILRFGVSAADQARAAGDLMLNYTLISVVLGLAWLVMLAVFRTRDPRILGVGATEYRLVSNATFALFGLAAIVLFLFKVDIARAYLLIAFPIGLVVLLIGRWIARQWLRAQRGRGESSYRVLLVGSSVSAKAIADDLLRAPWAGYRVVGAVLADLDGAVSLGETRVPVATDLDRIPELMAELGADTLVISSSDDLPPGKVRELSWMLEPGRQHLVMAPSLTDVGGPRIQVRPVAGLPLMHVETPRFVGAQAFVKRAFDVVVSAVLIVLLSPLLLVTAMAVRLSSPGAVLFRQERIGFQGEAFRMLKFRSMVVDAEAQLQSLLDRQGSEGNEVLFKMKDDPRVTPVGRFLRRYSIDELPQLFNVFLGDMSLVGPRPPLQREVDTYEEHVQRKFLVKPGITGLWQVSGRSNLSWEESVRLDLYYVENWSLMGDLVILWKTAKAVVARDGAY